MSIYLGIMSGTSLDGIDVVALKEENRKFFTIDRFSTSFEKELKKDLFALATQQCQEPELNVAGKVSAKLTQAYADATKKLLDKLKLSPCDISAIGVHGQTVRHYPELGFTIQLNNPSLLAELTQIDVIADFRSRDVAASGEGAPLVPIFHQKIFASEKENRAVLNIGGIANLSLLRTNGDIGGFDTGPGNMLIDSAMQHLFNEPFDKNGNIAKHGNISEKLLETLLADPYFEKSPPKSTGREYFSDCWLKEKITDFNLNPHDLIATLTELTAKSVAQSLIRQMEETQTLIVCGGGALNPTLISRLAINLKGINVTTSQSYGIDPMSVEGAAFAWLAWAFLHKVPGNVPKVTRARGPRILGAYYPK